LPKFRIWMPILLLLLLVVGYGGAKYVQYSREWREFEAAWQKVEAAATGTHGYSWKPGLFNAVGEMSLSGCEMTDARLAPLQGVSTLVKLDLSDNEITDAGLDHLAGLENLRELDLRNTKVSDEAVEQLKQVLPDCRIER